MNCYALFLDQALVYSEQLSESLKKQLEPHFTMFKSIVLPEAARNQARIDCDIRLSDSESGKRLRVLLDRAYGCDEQDYLGTPQFVTFVCLRLCSSLILERSCVDLRRHLEQEGEDGSV